MNYKLLVLLVVVFCGCLCATSLATPFQNLDFEQGSIQAPPANYVPWDAYHPISAAAGLPFWTAREDSAVCTAIWWNGGALDETSVALLSNIPIPPFGYPATPLSGNYSVELTSAYFSTAPSEYFKTSSISQTGDVPANAKSIQFLMWPYAPGVVRSDPLVTLNGSVINLIPISTNGYLATMAGDVSAFAGTNVELTITCAGTPGAPNELDRENNFRLDDIIFSPNPVPEPSTVALLGLGGLIAFVAKRRQAKTAH